MAAVSTLLRAAIASLREAGVDSPELDASLLLGDALGLPRERLLLEPGLIPTSAQQEQFARLLARRRAREPVAYLLGRREFFGLPFVVDRRVLIPRPDTECLVEAALLLLPSDGKGATVLDVGTGSGAIAAAIKQGRPQARVLASDLSPAALAVAQQNFRALGLAIETVPGDLLDPFAAGSLDLVVSNPPYLDPATAAGLMPELAFEPQEALFAPGAGLAALARLVADTPRVLRPGGWLLAEHGAEQGPATRAAAAAAGLQEIGTGRDLAGRERFLRGRNPRP